MTAKPRKIVLIVPQYPKLSETFINSHFIGLLKKGHDAYIYRLNPPKSNISADQYQTRIFTGQDFSSFPNLMKNLFKTFFNCLFHFKKLYKPFFRSIFHLKDFKLFLLDNPLFLLQPELLHFEFGSLAVPRIGLKRLLNCRIVVSFRGYDINFSGLSRLDYYDDVWECTDHFHFLGQSLLKRARERGYKKTNHTLIPPALSETTINLAQQGVLAKTHYTNKKIQLLSVGRLEWKKGYDYTLIALSRLKKAGIPFHYTLIGDGQYYEYLHFLKYQLGLTSCVTLTGPLPHTECLDHYITSHLFLHLAPTEGFCNAVLEAQAFGLPVLCGSGNGLKENILPDQTGFILNEKDTKMVAEKIKWFWEHDHQWKNFSERAHQHAIKFRQDNQLRTFDDMYDSIPPATK